METRGDRIALPQGRRGPLDKHRAGLGGGGTPSPRHDGTLLPGWRLICSYRGGLARSHVRRLHISPALMRHVYRGQQPQVRKGKKNPPRQQSNPNKHKIPDPSEKGLASCTHQQSAVHPSLTLYLPPVPHFWGFPPPGVGMTAQTVVSSSSFFLKPHTHPSACNTVP